MTTKQGAPNPVKPAPIDPAVRAELSKINPEIVAKINDVVVRKS